MLRPSAIPSAGKSPAPMSKSETEKMKGDYQMKLYRDIETGKEYSLSMLMHQYERDSGGYDNFGAYLNNCMTRNNGTLVELTSISPIEAERLRDAAGDLQGAFRKFAEALEVVDEQSIADYLSKHWPFSACLADMWFVMECFREDVTNFSRYLVRDPNA